MQFSDFDFSRFSQLFRGRRSNILVLGDYCLDKYLYRFAELDEPSVETGLTAYQIRDVRIFPGVGGTITANLASLGAKVFCLGLCGDDGEGFELRKALRACGADIRGLFVSSQIRTNTYMKPMTWENDRWVEMNRLDLRNAHAAPREWVQKVIDRAAEVFPKMDGMIVSDQFTFEAGSVVTDALRKGVAQLAAAYPDKPILGDSRAACGKYRNILVKCNAAELLACWRERGREIAPDTEADMREESLREAGLWLARRNRKPVMVTRGALGSLLFYKSGRAVCCREIPAIPVEPPYDVCGAGDATNAGFLLARSRGLSLEESALFAGVVSSITIRKIGVTGTASPDEVREVLKKLEGWKEKGE
ncbi:MAG: PfkB family carbohydrate kinase [Planctomycetia bacterium]|nr:PfkB family carbohydrate kinase [Planctomycetia bacterium]